MMYTPHNWVIIKFKGEDLHYRVLGGWSGGYLDGSSWRINSGIERHEYDGDYWYFYGTSGSCYKCYLDSYGIKMDIAPTWSRIQELHGDKVELVPDQAWIAKDWSWKE